MLHLHHLSQSRSFRILWLLEELELDYKLSRYERNKSYLAPDCLKKIQPLGHAPILEVDGKPLIESGFIIEYLLKHFDKERQFKPEDNNETAWENYTFWLHFAEGALMPTLVMRLVFTKVVAKSPMLIKPISKGIQKQVEHSMIANNLTVMLAMMDQHLSDNHWFAGASFSAADIQMYFAAAAANAQAPFDSAQFANILNWMKRCQARDAFQKAENKGGKLTFQ
ncbi:glutathione S-transferase [Psychrobacter ciconiae]|uniref:glutathione S-transferase n=1 Tax=Psychrobacter ciconiae TaxID=1553449 RepID=UPI001918A823|nr:glutathione S-transferase [Psychrobacter ciconiae]